SDFPDVPGVGDELEGHDRERGKGERALRAEKGDDPGGHASLRTCTFGRVRHGVIAGRAHRASSARDHGLPVTVPVELLARLGAPPTAPLSTPGWGPGRRTPRRPPGRLTAAS